MNTIKTFEELRNHLRLRGERKRMAVVCADDEATREAASLAEQQGIVAPIFVDGATTQEAAAKAVAMVREGEADILMKGLISTDQLLRAVLNKETGILTRGRVLTHIAAAEVPGYERMLFFTDAAVIPYPTDEQRIEQIRYVVPLCRALGVERPRVSLIHCAEHASDKFPHTMSYPRIKELAAEGEFGPCIVDGPLDVKTSCCRESMLTKGIESPIEGAADALIMPEIEAGNVFYKTLTLFAHAQTAGILAGPQAPVVVSSRADDTLSKLNSIALAAL